MSGTALGLLLAGLLAAWLRAMAPILLAALGGLVSERAGVINVGLEGLMLMAAFFGVLGSAYAPQWFAGAAAWTYPWVGALLGLAAAVALAMVLAVFHLELGADLIVAGMGINLLASGITAFAMVATTGDKGSTAGLLSYALPVLHVPGFAQWPVVDAFFNGGDGRGHHVLVYGALCAVAGMAWLLWRTRLGLRLRAVGENLPAARAAGIAVKRVQYVALALSGLLAGCGGLYLSMGYLTLFQSDMTAGRGFLALAAVFLGGRRPLGTFAASLLFGAASVLAAQLGLLHMPTQLVYMVAPLATVVAMVLFQWRRERLRRRALALALHRLASSHSYPLSDTSQPVA